MNDNNCNKCGTKLTRTFGIATVLAILFTGGIWLLAIPFYSKNCKRCGTIPEHNGNHGCDITINNWYRKWQIWAAILLVLLCGHVLSTNKDELNHQATATSGPPSKETVLIKLYTYDNGHGTNPCTSYYDANSIQKDGKKTYVIMYDYCRKKDIMVKHDISIDYKANKYALGMAVTYSKSTGEIFSNLSFNKRGWLYFDLNDGAGYKLIANKLRYK